MKTAKRMVGKSLLVVALILLGAPLSVAAGLGHLRISYMKGDVQVKTPESGEWGIAAVNAPLAEGDQVWVPPGGRVELQLDGGSYLRLDRSSSLQVLSLEEDSSQFYLAQGRVYAYFDPRPGAVLQIDTPDASTRAFQDSVFRVDLGDDFSDVSVYKGYVEAENRVGTRRIDAGQMLSLSQDSDGEVAPMAPPDDWESWNKSRNRRIFAGGGSSAYLPDELAGYAPDFDSNGRWVSVQEYGNVWTPTVYVGVDWSPYREGRWIWRGGQYVWIGYEPWGWAPYHYGRWAFVNRVGWCWVPPPRRAVYWAPGYVGWVTTRDHVAWVPLAPGEVYYGRGYYGPNSVNITHVNVTEVRITNVYRNVHVHNGVTAVRRNSFATARPARVRADSAFVRSNLLARGGVRPGAPDIRPGREGALLSGRTVPRAKLPPQRVRTLEVPVLKRERPLVREPQRSVLVPGGAARPLPVRSVETPRHPGSGRPVLNQAVPNPAAPVPTTDVGGHVRRRSPGAPPPVQPQTQRETQPQTQRERVERPQGVKPESTQRSTVPAVPHRGERGVAPPAATVTPAAPATTPAPPAAPAPRQSAPHHRVRPHGSPERQGMPPMQTPSERKGAPSTFTPPATTAPSAAPQARPSRPSAPETPVRTRERENAAPAQRAVPATPASPAQVRPHVQHPARPAVETPAARPAERAVPASPAVPAERRAPPRSEHRPTATPAAVAPPAPAAVTAPAPGPRGGAAATPAPAQRDVPRSAPPERWGRGGDRD